MTFELLLTSNALKFTLNSKFNQENIYFPAKMMGGARMPPNPQAAMMRRPKPEDAANHISVRLSLFSFVWGKYHRFCLTTTNCGFCRFVLNELSSPFKKWNYFFLQMLPLSYF